MEEDVIIATLFSMRTMTINWRAWKCFLKEVSAMIHCYTGLYRQEWSLRSPILRCYDITDKLQAGSRRASLSC